MRNFTYTALTPIKVGGVFVPEGESVVLDEQTGDGLVSDGLVELASDEPVEVSEPTQPRRVVSKPAAKAAAKKKASK